MDVTLYTSSGDTTFRRWFIMMFAVSWTLCGYVPAQSAGFQIPNQSLRAVGIAGATIAHTTGPEAAFYNPANMSFLPDAWSVETSLTTLYLPEINYKDYRSPFFDAHSESETFFLPQLHLNSRKYNKFRFGFALTYPYGLSKEWQQPYPAATAKKFSLFVAEANPSIAYMLHDRFSIGGGIRLIYAEGEVENSVTNPPFSDISPLSGVSREISSANDMETGYNLAASFKPTPTWKLAATYRSEISLELEGDATLLALSDSFPVSQYLGSGTLPISLPAMFSLATSYTFSDLTVELTWSRTFWSAIDELDFQYTQSFLGTVFDPFDRSQPKNWNDTDALRLGLTYNLSDTFQATAGFAIDETPVPENTLGFELPDSDAFMYCLGMQYTASDRIRIGISYMYHYTSSRSVEAQPAGGLPPVNGKFTEGGAHAVTIGLITTL